MNSQERADKIVDQLQIASDRFKETNRLEVIWDSSLANPTINMDDEELDEFLKTFSDDKQGRSIQGWVFKGAQCEAKNEDLELDDPVVCEERSIGSVDFRTLMSADSVLSCREHIRPVYESIVVKAVREQGIVPEVTINGKSLPLAKVA